MNEITLNLDRNLIFFDIETTGLNVLKDRIIQIALIKFNKINNTPEEKTYLLNPGVPIQPEAMAIHGIMVDMIRNKPLFKDIANELYDWIGHADLAGYNCERFDIPLLMEEFARVGLNLDMEKRRCLDVQKIFYKMEPRTLRAAYRLYCNKELTNAHDALEDARATMEVFLGQIKKYKEVDYIDEEGRVIETPIQNNIQAIVEFIGNNDQIDFTNRLKYNSEGIVVFNFGKYIGKPVTEVFTSDPQYYNWIMDKDFSHQVKQVVTRIKNDMGKKNG
ncbi:MAG TPA: 3'-5' exonuclease [Saprospiraceae bacterium]|nr:3'-5' exonuclease [Saprospiraceae bacterium]